MAKKEKFMTPKKSVTFYKGARRYQRGNKIPPAVLKDKDGKNLKLDSLEDWQEPAEEKAKIDLTSLKPALADD